MESQGRTATTTGEAEEKRISEIMLRDMEGLKRQLVRLTRNSELADDILQDSIVTALQKLHAGEISMGASLDGYVYRVALNHFRNYQRKDKSWVSEDCAIAGLTDIKDSGMPESAAASQWADVAKAVLKEVYPARDRELLVRFYLREETKEDLCKSFALSELHFNRVIFRARERFRELLARRGLKKSDLLSFVLILFAA